MNNQSNQAGWIKVHRKILEWEWWDDPNTFRVFMYCLLRANHSDKKYRGTTVEKGSFLTGLHVMAEKTKLSIQQVRTSLNKLISTNEITKESTSKGTRIYVVNWEKYQDKESEVTNKITSKPTNEQQTNNKPITTNKNDKNVKNEKKHIGEVVTPVELELKEIVDYYNEIYEKNIRSTRGFKKNFFYWREVYDLDQMKQAILFASKDKFWKTKLTLTILFRQRNPRGEDVDYIQDLSNRKPQYSGEIAFT